ncbi:MAG: ABC transporter permease [Ginsengibacter sp.]
MFKNYFKIAWRNLLRNKALSFINISGLSIGLACCMLIFLYTKDEVSYDRFHEKKDQLFRLTCRIVPNDGKEVKYGLAAMVEGPGFKEEIPEIKDFVRVKDEEFIVKNGNETFTGKGLYVDENFFSVFSFPLIAGNPKTVLAELQSVVLTDETAIKYFGTTDAVGKMLELEINNKFEPFTVSGVAKRSPQNSSIKFTMLLPFKFHEKTDPENGWLWLSYPTFLVMDSKTDLKTVAAKMNLVYASKAHNDIIDAQKHGDLVKFVWGVQPMLQMHLDSETEGTNEASNPIYSYILTGIALFILLIACINFVNLTVAQSLKRSKEIGIRKVVGGQRGQLIRQFLGESFILCFIAFVLAILLAQLVLPVFNNLSNKRLSLGYLFDFKLVAAFIGLYIVTGLAAGFYPALVLSGFDPVKTLYNRNKFSGKNYLSKSLVVVQFALATFLIIATLFIYAQFDYLTHEELGYNDKNLLEVTVGQGRNKSLMDLFKNEFAKEPGVTMVAPRMGGEWITRARSLGKEFDVKYEHIDENYLPTLHITLLAGRNFSKDFPGDSTQSILVNEAFVKEAGWKDPIGKKVDFLNGNPCNLAVVGIVKDFHFESLKEKIKPQLFSAEQSLPFGKFYIRIRPDNIPKTLKAIEKTYRALVHNHPFQYAFKEDLNYKNYEAENKWKQIFSSSAMLTIFISCIGLFGLTMLSIQKRMKEIGVRKVLGASVLQVSALVSKNFITLVFIAFIIAIPAAWFATASWLQNFAYRIEIHWWLFAVAALLTVIIALVTVSFQAIKAGLANPVKSLRTE